MSSKLDKLPNKVRIDKWLWAARFFKTRQLSVKALKNGKVSLNNQNCKPASTVKVGDLLLVKRGYLEMQIEILELSENRGPAAIAQTLYCETENSKAQRKKMSDTIKSQPKIEFELRKPDKRGVREHRALKRRDN